MEPAPVTTKTVQPPAPLYGAGGRLPSQHVKSRAEMRRAMTDALVRATAEGVPGYLNGHTKAMLRLGANLETIVTRLVDYVTADAERIVLPNGATQVVLKQPELELTAGQLDVLRTMLPRIMPSEPLRDFAPQGGDAPPGQTPVKIAVSINTVGPALDARQQSGVVQGAAVPVTKITFNSPASPPTLDVLPEEETNDDEPHPRHTTVPEDEASVPDR